MYTPIKELGQNFLIDSTIPVKMVDYLDLKPDDVVVEIGPGLGALTDILSQQLLSETSEIHAIEIDKRFVEKLKNMYIDQFNIDIVENNILDWLPTYKPTKPFKIIGSLPYYITSPIIHTIIKHPNQAETCVILIQKEVAERIGCKPHDESYMSIFVKTFYDLELLDVVNRKKFDPEPGVDGQILKMKRVPEARIPFDKITKYEGFLHRGFSNPRKMINKVFSKEELQRVGVDSNLRPQDIPVEKWVEMFTTLTN